MLCNASGDRDCDMVELTGVDYRSALRVECVRYLLSAQNTERHEQKLNGGSFDEPSLHEFKLMLHRISECFRMRDRDQHSILVRL